MRIQTKLFIVLLVLSVLPLAALTWRVQRATEGLGQSIVEGGRAAVIASIEDQLRQAMEYSSDLLSTRQRLVDTALRAQVSEVERLLALPADPAAADGAPIYFDSAFQNPVAWPPGTALSLDRSVMAGNGQIQAIPISRLHQSFFVPQNAVPNPSEMRQLVPLTEFHVRMAAANPDLFYWQYVALESGLIAVYPGHGSYPSGYDPRRRVWYQLAMTAGDLAWTPPMLDAATRRLLLTAAMPVRGPGGQFVGVAAIDVDILAQLASIHDQMRLGPRAESFIARMSDADGDVYIPGESDGRPQLRIIASSSRVDSGAAWDTKVEEPVLASPADGDFAAMIDDLIAGKAGLRRLVHKDGDAIWVYRQLGRLSSVLVYVVPVDDVEGLADRAQDSIREATLEQVRLAGLASVALIALVGLAAMFASRTVTRPLRALAATAQDLAAGDLEARAPVSGRDEIGELAAAFNSMVPELRSHIMVKESLVIARDAQQRLLPVAAPQVAGFEIAGHSVYSEAIGGDYYDFVEMTDEARERRIGIVVGDVTGHGIPAALTMTAVRALVQSHAGAGYSALPVMRAVNRHLTADSARGTFVTLVFMIIEPGARGIRWISAGHGPILFYDADRDMVEELEAHDIPLGVQTDWNFHESYRYHWPRAGVLFIGTDGIWESQNSAGEMFGRDRLMEVVREHAHLSATDL
ncbi:MAG: SpoIIE family protein phosphatase, partial [Rhodospirillaceae bacterium]|nr:SpoIIE family protein phosphatase [Rhodospirillaceae bacterium]